LDLNWHPVLQGNPLTPLPGEERQHPSCRAHPSCFRAAAEGSSRETALTLLKSHPDAGMRTSENEYRRATQPVCASFQHMAAGLRGRKHLSNFNSPHCWGMARTEWPARASCWTELRLLCTKPNQMEVEVKLILASELIKSNRLHAAHATLGQQEQQCQSAAKVIHGEATSRTG